MCGTVGSYRSNKKGKVMIGGIAAANLRSLYFHALLPERERGCCHQGLSPFFFSSSLWWGMAAGALNLVDT